VGGGLSIALWLLALHRVHQQYGERIFAIAVSGTNRQQKKRRLMAHSSGGASCGLPAMFARISSKL
jgi:hypothetical protein